MIMKRMFVGIAVMVALGFVRPAFAEMVVIVNKDNPLATISRGEVEMIYLGKKKQFPDGSPAVPVDLPADSPLRREFFTTVLGKAEESYRLYWVRMIFSGKGQPPLTLGDEDEAVKFVSRNKGGIAFVESGGMAPGVKTVTISGMK